MNRHQRTVHENEKPLKCKICPISFGGKDWFNLKNNKTQKVFFGAFYWNIATVSSYTITTLQNFTVKPKFNNVKLI